MKIFKTTRTPEVETEPETALTGIQRHEQQEAHQRTLKAQEVANKRFREAQARLLYLEREHGAVLQEIESLRALVRPNFLQQYSSLLNAAGNRGMSSGTSGIAAIGGLFGDIF